MCTLTFIPRNDRYLLAMNRDDLFSRGSAFPLVRMQFARHSAVYPQEAGGGTWIGLNQHGIAFALLNWGVAAQGPKQRSRGTVIPQVLVALGQEHAHMLFDDLQLAGIHPFRLLGFFPADRAVHEWRWDGVDRGKQSHEWGARHWFSSGASDEEAERTRAAVCARHWRDQNPGTRAWMRQLHASHEPTAGAFSICAHRSAGGTLSYTEIEVAREHMMLAYSPASPCKGIDISDQAVLPRLPHTRALA